MPSNSIAASATPPMRWASPSRPMAAVATSPRSGVVRLASIAGPAIENTRAWVIRKEELRSASTRRPHQAHDQPDRHHQHGAQKEVAPQPLEGLEAHVPDGLKELPDAADDVERIKLEHVENDTDQDRQERQLEYDGERPPAEEAGQRTRALSGVGDLGFRGRALGRTHGGQAITFHDLWLPCGARASLPASRAGRPRLAACP